MKRVYLPNRGAHDYSAAEKFGKLTTLTAGPIKLTGTGYLYRVMAKALEHSAADDYILICGPTIANVVATGIFANKHARLNMLIYKASHAGGRYYERTILFEGNNYV